MSNRQSQHQAIRDLFAGLGGGHSTRAIAMMVRDAGIYSDDQLDSAELRWLQEEVRRALKTPDAAGLPLAGQTTERDAGGAALWKQRALWRPSDYQLNVDELIGQRDECHVAAVALRDECFDRFGVAVVLPQLPDDRPPARRVA